MFPTGERVAASSSERREGLEFSRQIKSHLEFPTNKIPPLSSLRVQGHRIFTWMKLLIRGHQQVAIVIRNTNFNLWETAQK